MHAGRSYTFLEFLRWTRRPLYALILLDLALVALYQMAGWHWLAVPWNVIFMLGTTVALIVGFKNTQTYNRLWEAQQVWASITSASRVWGAMTRDYVGSAERTRRLAYRHVAWLTVLRYQMRDSKVWETTHAAPNVEYRKHYEVPEKARALDMELNKYVAGPERARILGAGSRATEVLNLQGADLKQMLDAGQISASAFAELQRVLRDLHDQQARSERLKNYPYPRQYAIINVLFVRILCVLLPLGMIDLFAPLDDVVGGVMAGHMVWLAVPLSALVSWMYASLDQVGENSANPFEGGANDIPISQICVSIEMDLRQLLDERDVPEAPVPVSPILL